MNALVVSRSDTRRGFMVAALGPAWTIRMVSDGLEAVKACKEDPQIAVVVADETTEPFGAFGLSRELTNLEAPPAILLLLDRVQDTWLAKWSRADRWLVEPVDAFTVEAEARALWAGRVHSTPTR